jgi:hypothetical protein
MSVSLRHLKAQKFKYESHDGDEIVMRRRFTTWRKPAAGAGAMPVGCFVPALMARCVASPPAKLIENRTPHHGSLHGQAYANIWSCKDAAHKVPVHIDGDP